MTTLQFRQEVLVYQQARGGGASSSRFILNPSKYEVPVIAFCTILGPSEMDGLV
jgi:hypothetical protein